MSCTNRTSFDVLSFAMLCCALAACATHSGDDDSGNNQGGSGGTIAAGTGGTVAAGTGGTVAAGTGGMIAAGSGGMIAAGSGGMTAGGSGGMHGGGSGGMTAGGSGGTNGSGGMDSADSGTGGMMGDSGMAADNQCVTEVTTDDPMTDAKCAACLCDKCNAEVTAMKGDAKAHTLFECGRTKNCSGFCCFCGSASCDLTNYRMGACPDEVEMAAGVPSPSDAIVDGTNLQTTCMMSGSSCNKPIVLADCMMKMCPSDCPPVTACN